MYATVEDLVYLRLLLENLTPSETSFGHVFQVGTGFTLYRLPSFWTVILQVLRSSPMLPHGLGSRVVQLNSPDRLRPLSDPQEFGSSSFFGLIPANRFPSTRPCNGTVTTSKRLRCPIMHRCTHRYKCRVTAVASSSTTICAFPWFRLVNKHRTYRSTKRSDVSITELDRIHIGLSMDQLGRVYVKARGIGTGAQKHVARDIAASQTLEALIKGHQ
ncbi:uncharacterized protein BT62DRAFT_999898 [Guyanagaster necrorhizus]|uniref:Uncharacterized protein n=1 Tax=Guyanagaster necrorhizus TaxID=856835 RepID=A0A9P7W4S7_9AGAR|nr:uncharacterized protein BT62DRAFT_999898 [Guyanagaster necrorhizus MCA 3950]KAG7452138.1 hypothetical protein BT62DRAFT_999898 [Guyanagaster necrorhizus MCA 3950]